MSNVFSSGTFVSREAELVFYLNKLDGKNRNDLLGIKKIHYTDTGSAYSWYQEIRNQIFPRNEECRTALVNLDEIYKSMSGWVFFGRNNRTEH